MRYRALGRSGFQVSEIGHGLWGMSNWSGSDDAESLRALQLAASLGCNFFDTAWAYGDGKSDGLLGQLLAQSRSQPGVPGERALGSLGWKRLFAASKVPPRNRKWPATAEYPYGDVFPYEHVLEYAELIRGKLGVATIDLLQFHVWDDSWAEHPDFRRTVEKLKRDGIIGAFGISLNRWEPWNGLRALRTGLVDVVQVIYNIFDQAPDDELFPACRELNIGVIARVPFDEGGLTGKLTLETRFPQNDWRASYFGAENLAATVERAERLKQLLPEGEDGQKMSLPEMALRFILSNRDVSTTIAGMRKPEHVQQNIAASDAGPLPAVLLHELKRHRWDRKPKPWSA